MRTNKFVSDEYDEEELEDESEALVLHSGVFMLSGMIDTVSTNQIMAAIIAECAKGTSTDITIIVNSGGGSISAAFALISVIRSSSIPVTTIALGECSSAALMIFMSGATRYVDKNASILSHQFSASFPGHAKAIDLRARQKELEIVEKKLEDHYMQCSGLSRKKIRKELLTSSDVFLSPEELIEYNLADGYYTTMEQFLPPKSQDVLELSNLLNESTPQK